MEYLNSKMCKLSLIRFYFFLNGRIVPEGMNFVGGRIIGDPRVNNKYWVIGKDGLFEIFRDSILMAKYDGNVASMIEAFA